MAVERVSREEMLEKYKYEVEHLSRYIPWLQRQTAEQVTSMYTGDGTHATFSFPVYDSTLLSFINDVGVSCFMDTNYHYVYSRNHIRTHEDEWKAIERVTVMDMEILNGILSKYVLGGMTKAVLWKEGVQYEIFLRVLLKAKEIVEYWDKPLPDSGDFLE